MIIFHVFMEGIYIYENTHVKSSLLNISLFLDNGIMWKT